MSLSVDYDVAIVGGGISGIYTAWRLLTSNLASSAQLSAWARARPDGKLRVAVFEGSERIGGRLLSAQPPGMPHTVVEIGGMRYVSSQTLVRSLVENELKLPTKPQTVQVDSNLAYLRAKRLHISDLKNPAVLPYTLAADEAEWCKTHSASDLIGLAISKVLPQAPTLQGPALEEYLQNATVDGVPLYQVGFWNMLARAMTFEAYQLARTAVGYDSLGANANAVDMVREYFNFTPSVRYSLLKGGYESVPWELERQTRQAGGHIHLHAWLESCDALRLGDGTTGMSLQFRGGTPGAVSARALVLAMPRRSIELLRSTGALLDPQRAPRLQSLLQSVEPIALYKMFICYDQPWWEKEGLQKGRSLTDIPIRQCYYWAVDGREEGGDPRNTNATLMNYNDVSSVDFWGGLRRHTPQRSRVHAELAASAAAPARWRERPLHGGGAFVRKPMPYAQVQSLRETASSEMQRRLRANWDAHEAPAEMVAEMHRQLELLHDVQDAPKPLEAAYMDWSDDPYGAGVHFWNSGYKSWEVLQEMTQPVRELPCYVCGEAWSTNQTWAEGALQTAEIVLQQRFCLAPPPWVS